jgi:TRAP-type mannitol/chloroaromatic compound transport system substrate-binding protein
MTTRPTRRSLLAVGGAAVMAAPAMARATGTERRWRCVTSWSRNMVGPGVSARRLAEGITLMSNRELVIEVFAAG